MDRTREAVYRSIAKYPHKQDARIKLNNAVRCGKIYRPDCCENCEDLGKVHGHHEDYSKPLEVLWVCSDCHTEIHND